MEVVKLLLAVNYFEVVNYFSTTVQLQPTETFV